MPAPSRLTLIFKLVPCGKRGDRKVFDVVVRFSNFHFGNHPPIWPQILWLLLTLDLQMIIFHIDTDIKDTNCYFAWHTKFFHSALIPLFYVSQKNSFGARAMWHFNPEKCSNRCAYEVKKRVHKSPQRLVGVKAARSQFLEDATCTTPVTRRSKKIMVLILEEAQNSL